MLISPEMAIVNSKIKPEFSCNKSDCRSFSLCRPEGVVDGEKYIVTDIIGNASDICDKGRALHVILLVGLLWDDALARAHNLVPAFSGEKVRFSEVSVKSE